MDVVMETERIPQVGESVVALSNEQLPGGKGANTAVAAYRGSHLEPKGGSDAVNVDPEVELRICMNGAVGDDSFGPKLNQQLRKNGVDVTGVQTKEMASGSSVVFVETDTGRTLSVGFQGANHIWQPQKSQFNGRIRCRKEA